MSGSGYPGSGVPVVARRVLRTPVAAPSIRRRCWSAAFRSAPPCQPIGSLITWVRTTGAR